MNTKKLRVVLDKLNVEEFNKSGQIIFFNKKSSDAGVSMIHER